MGWALLSSDSGANWTNSLVPGYPGDPSAAGQASPVSGFVGNTGDPVQAWDRWGHMYYGMIGFNRAKPNNGSIFMARYNWPMVATAPQYEFTSLVSRGTPGNGIFEDKVAIEVDRGVASPYAGSASRPYGNVYMCWARFTPGTNNFVYFARSEDGGRTWDTQKLSESIHGSQFCDIAVTKSGMVFVAWRQYDFKPDRGQMQGNAVAWTRSTDGGRSFTKTQTTAPFVGWDPTDHYGSPAAAGQAVYTACLAADFSHGGCSGPQPRNDARSCGDGPLQCQSGYVFFRVNSQVRITADPSAAGDPDAAYVVYDPSVPGSETATGTSYGTVNSGTGTQAAIFFTKTENGGGSWSPPTQIDPVANGHQFFPDIDADAGRLYAVYHDSRADCASGPTGTEADFRTVPISNHWVGGSVGSIACEAGLETRYAVSTNGGDTWSSVLASSSPQMPQREQFGNRDTPFHGDYNYISAEGAISGQATKVLMNWTDERNAVPGDDPRYDIPNVDPDDGTDGFDVVQCRTFSSGAWSADTCPNSGGLDQNIYGFVTAG